MIALFTTILDLNDWVTLSMIWLVIFLAGVAFGWVGRGWHDSRTIDLPVPTPEQLAWCSAQMRKGRARVSEFYNQVFCSGIEVGKRSRIE